MIFPLMFGVPPESVAVSVRSTPDAPSRTVEPAFVSTAGCFGCGVTGNAVVVADVPAELIVTAGRRGVARCR